MAKDDKAARDEQAAGWRERIDELTSGKSNQRGADSAEEDEDDKTHRSTGRSQQENSEAQPTENESARDFIERRMREERDKGGK